MFPFPFCWCTLFCGSLLVIVLLGPPQRPLQATAFLSLWGFYQVTFVRHNTEVTNPVVVVVSCMAFYLTCMLTQGTRARKAFGGLVSLAAQGKLSLGSKTSLRCCCFPAREWSVTKTSCPKTVMMNSGKNPSTFVKHAKVNQKCRFTLKPETIQSDRWIDLRQCSWKGRWSTFSRWAGFSHGLEIWNLFQSSGKERENDQVKVFGRESKGTFKTHGLEKQKKWTSKV